MITVSTNHNFPSHCIEPKSECFPSQGPIKPAVHHMFMIHVIEWKKTVYNKFRCIGGSVRQPPSHVCANLPLCNQQVLFVISTSWSGRDECVHLFCLRCSSSLLGLHYGQQKYTSQAPRVHAGGRILRCCTCRWKNCRGSFLALIKRKVWWIVWRNFLLHAWDNPRPQPILWPEGSDGEPSLLQILVIVPMMPSPSTSWSDSTPDYEGRHLTSLPVWQWPALRCL